MPVFKKFISVTRSSGVKLIKRYLPTVRSIEPDPRTAGIVQGIGLDSISLGKPQEQVAKQQHRLPKPGTNVADILQEVKATDGLPPNPSHVEHLIGRATKGRIYQKHLLQQQSPVELSQSNAPAFYADGDQPYNIPLDATKTQEKYEVGGIDIAEKTQLVLQSAHPVRYVIERELLNSQRGLHLRLPSYHTWIMLFGRSLVPRLHNASIDNETYDDRLLDNVANASDSGMFSADIHHTIIDIPENHPSFLNCSSQFHNGNKYAVLVGDYFAIRCIYYAERTKTNNVMVAITEGVEEFTTSTFGTNLFDKSVGCISLLSPNASVHDWILYNQKAFGYLKGGLYAAFSLQHKPKSQNKSTTNLDAQMEKFVSNFTAFLKACEEIEALQQTESVVPRCQQYFVN